MVKEAFICLIIFLNASLAIAKTNEVELFADEVSSALNLVLCVDEIGIIKSSVPPFLNEDFSHVVKKVKLLWPLENKEGDLFTYFSVRGYPDPSVVALKILEMYHFRLNNELQPIDIVLTREKDIESMPVETNELELYLDNSK